MDGFDGKGSATTRPRCSFGRTHSIGIILLAALSTLAGCGMASMDPQHRHLVSAGLGGASITDSKDEPLDLRGGWSLHGAYESRLIGSEESLFGLSARAVTLAVIGARTRDGVPADSCDLFWASTGPAFGVQVPAYAPTSLTLDAGFALAYVARGSCSTQAKSADFAVVPQLGMGLRLGVTSKTAWGFGGRWVRLPLNDIGISRTKRWAGAGEFSLLFSF